MRMIIKYIFIREIAPFQGSALQMRMIRNNMRILS